ncbi:MAG: single-stranded-DNA-specific exonuclease RecJ [Acidiferrobacterales bacterium]
MRTTKRILRRQCPPSIHHLPNDLHPVLARVYAARHVSSADELDRSLARLQHPRLLKGIDTAVELLGDAVTNNKHITIVADFDADGATGCALAVRALRAMGAGRVSYVVPDRFRYGYGLTPEIVALAAAREPDLLVTVDNGISSLDGVQAAHERGIAVLITDHHLPGSALPTANAIVNPNQPADTFPSKSLAGVGVMFYVMMALRMHLRERGWFNQGGCNEPNLAKLLDLVALGTVADLVPLDHNNRILVQNGLAQINRGDACAGIRALLQVSRRDRAGLAATDLGFLVAPRLNAAGRLEDMSLGIDCLLTDDLAATLNMARRLDALNRERQAIQADMQAQAFAAVEALQLNGDSIPNTLCLFDPGWHQGIIGLVASRLKERFDRPAIAFAIANSEELKGSARSIAGLHIRDVLDAVAARHPDLLQRFGGHAMAAGVSLRRENLERFCITFEEEVGRQLLEDNMRGVILSDGELTAKDLTVELATLLRDAGPWGQGFPEPVFDGHFDVVGSRVVGDKHLKLSLRCDDHNKIVDGIAFNQVEGKGVNISPRAHAAYKLDVNDYQGYRTVQLVIEHLEPVS